MIVPCFSRTDILVQACPALVACDTASDFRKAKSTDKELISGQRLETANVFYRIATGRQRSTR